jgi:phage tail-like protein
MAADSYLHTALYPSGMSTPAPVPVAPDQRREIGGMYFSVVVDGHELGDWFRVDGLSVKFELAEYRAGDARNHRWIEPAYTTYANVKLSRMTTLRYTSRLLAWMQETAFSSKKATATITGYPHWHGSHEQAYIVKWNLRGVLPVMWTGPQFDATSGKPASESLELAHEGFLENDA